MSTSNAMAAEALIGWAERLRANSTQFALLNVPAASVGVAFSGGIGTVAAQPWQTGWRVRFQSINIFGGASISPLQTGIDYFLIRDSATAFRVAATASGSPLAVPDFASGDYNLALSTPSLNWTIAELIAHELTHPQYSRLAVPLNLPNPTNAGTIARLELSLAVITNTSATPYAYNGLAVIKNGAAAGTTTGTLLEAMSVAAVSIVQGAPQSIIHRLTID